VEHDLQAISVRSVKLKEVREDAIVVVGDPIEEQIGCLVCGMTVEETIEVPSCPGRKVKDMVAELTEGLEFPDRQE
jgi:hypothetical protein